MSLVKQPDVKNRLSTRYRSKIHLCNPVSQRDPVNFFAAEPDAIQANSLNFSEDFVAEHSSPGTDLAQGNPLIGSLGPQAPAASKSVQP